MITQSNAILEYLESGATLTAIEALNLFSCMRLAARILDLKDEGHNITGQMVKNMDNGKSYKRYRMGEIIGHIHAEKTEGV